nr:uncharacterized protein LOC113810253 [Penaeus vannamei]
MSKPSTGLPQATLTLVLLLSGASRGIGLPAAASSPHGAGNLVDTSQEPRIAEKASAAAQRAQEAAARKYQQAAYLTQAAQTAQVSAFSEAAASAQAAKALQAVDALVEWAAQQQHALSEVLAASEAQTAQAHGGQGDDPAGVQSAGAAGVERRSRSRSIYFSSRPWECRIWTRRKWLRRRPSPLRRKLSSKPKEERKAQPMVDIIKRESYE